MNQAACRRYESKTSLRRTNSRSIWAVPSESDLSRSFHKWVCIVVRNLPRSLPFGIDSICRQTVDHVWRWKHVRRLFPPSVSRLLENGWKRDWNRAGTGLENDVSRLLVSRLLEKDWKRTGKGPRFETSTPATSCEGREDYSVQIQRTSRMQPTLCSRRSRSGLVVVISDNNTV